MAELLDYLNSPNLVANFQKIFGIEANFCIQKQFLNCINNKNDKNVKLKSRKKANDLEKDKKMKEQEQNNVLINENDLNKKNEYYKIHNKFWFYLFHIGAAMGNELFYSLFFPFWFWNVDGAIARKVSIVWAIFMYVGQATKDILEKPRPATPPVVKLEERYVQEYGFPSTHAMTAAGLPITLLILSYSRYNINLPISICMCLTFCIWVCASRLYLGMHSLLDVIAGVLYSVIILALVIPFLDSVDRFQLTNSAAPFIVFLIGLMLCHFYPSLKRWSTARGDTTLIIGVVTGFSIGSYLNYYSGFLIQPVLPPLYDIKYPNTTGYFLGIIRTILGMLTLYATRTLFKLVLLRIICFYHKLDYKDEKSKKEKKVELPYYYLTYIAIGFNITFTSPATFRLLNIARDYTYTEL